MVGKNISDLRVVINGAGAAGTAIARLIAGVGVGHSSVDPVKDVLLCDSRGVIARSREDLNEEKEKLLTFSNTDGLSGSLKDALNDADVFIGVSKGNLLMSQDISSMATNAIIFAMANPVPEIMPEEAKKGGAAVVGTGRSDFPNQVNNVLVFPGIFRGALDARAPAITSEMKVAAALALAGSIETPTADTILPHPLDRTVAPEIAKHVRAAARA